MNAEPATPSPQAAASAVVAALEQAWTAIRAHHPDVPERERSTRKDHREDAFP